jgi:hypothetical protein
MNDTVCEVLRALRSRPKGEWVFPSDTGTTPLDGQNFVNRVFIKGAQEGAHRRLLVALPISHP